MTVDKALAVMLLPLVIAAFLAGRVWRILRQAYAAGRGTDASRD